MVRNKGPHGGWSVACERHTAENINIQYIKSKKWWNVDWCVLLVSPVLRAAGAEHAPYITPSMDISSRNGVVRGRRGQQLEFALTCIHDWFQYSGRSKQQDVELPLWVTVCAISGVVVVISKWDLFVLSAPLCCAF